MTDDTTMPKRPYRKPRVEPLGTVERIDEDALSPAQREAIAALRAEHAAKPAPDGATEQPEAKPQH